MRGQPERKKKLQEKFPSRESHLLSTILLKQKDSFLFFFSFLLIASLTSKERFTSVRIMIEVIKFTILTAQAFRRIHSLWWSHYKWYWV